MLQEADLEDENPFIIGACRKRLILRTTAWNDEGHAMQGAGLGYNTAEEACWNIAYEHCQQAISWAFTTSSKLQHQFVKDARDVAKSNLCV